MTTAELWVLVVVYAIVAFVYVVGTLVERWALRECDRIARETDCDRKYAEQMKEMESWTKGKP